MLLRRFRGPGSLLVIAAIIACGGGDPTGTGDDPSSVVIVSGNGQVGLVGQSLSSPLVVRVTAASVPAAGVGVAFAVTSGSATVSPATTTTDAQGQATTQVTLGSSPGNVTITATVATNSSLVATFSLVAGSGNLNAACQEMQPTTPAVGAVQTDVGGTGICLGGGTSGAEYALIAFNSSTNATTGSNLPFSVSGFGVNPVVLASTVPEYGAATSLSLSAGQSTDVRDAFDLHLREIANRELAPLVPAAVAAMQRRPAFATIPANPAIGTIYTLNANGVQACTQIKSRGGRVAAVSTKAIIIADTANPAGGFTDAEYASFAATFDTLISPIDVQAFGQPSDIDNNGKIVIFFTKEVNALTPAGSAGVIGGFFFERDLFPTGDTSEDFAPCAGSNEAEMFYVMVPDPDGTVNGNKRTKDRVLDVTPGTLVHEYQHLINAGRRMYVNLPFLGEFEEVWLNEGLSHIAEELLYYHVAGFAPRQNLTVQTLAANQHLVDVFNQYQADNSGRFEYFLDSPNHTSVYADNDSLETRGATWHLLRYLADHRGSSDGDTWSRLVNTNIVGHANLAQVFGSTYMTQIRNWAISVYTDDLTGVTDDRFLEPSWNMRNIFPKLVDGAGNELGKYPLAVVPLSNGLPSDLTIYSGGTAYVRFGVSGGGQASIDWSAAGLPISPLIQLTLVRTK